MLKSGLVRTAKDKEILLEQKPATEIFMLLDGSVILSVQDGTIDLATLTKGDFFGLTSVFKNAPMIQASAGPGGARVATFTGSEVSTLATANEDFGKNLAFLAKERSIRARECADFMDKW